MLSQLHVAFQAAPITTCLSPSCLSTPQVLSQLPALHQLNFRGCPIADEADYQAKLLQQLPMLDVLDSKKIAKSGVPRSIKPVLAAAKQPRKPNIDLESDKVVEQGMGADSMLKSKKKRQLHADVDTTHAPAAKKAHKEKLATTLTATLDAVTTHTGVDRGILRADRMQAVDEQEDQNAGTEDGQKPEKKSKSKAKKASMKQADAADSSRSFLADVLNPVESTMAQLLPVKVPNANAEHKPAAAAASGLLRVIEAAPAKKLKDTNAKHGKDTAGKQKANRVSGPNAVQLLQSGLGLDTAQVGLGGGTAWG